jgi:ribosomal subunit interface protein
MKVQINTDKNVEGSDRLDVYFSSEIERVLSRFNDKITRIEVHFGDENSAKTGFGDKRCLIEARPANMQPIAVTEHADSIEKAFNGALDKIKKVLNTTFEKQKEH